MLKIIEMDKMLKFVFLSKKENKDFILQKNCNLKRKFILILSD